MRNDYFDTMNSIERIHRLFMNILDSELSKKRIRDINNTQVLVLYHIGHQKLNVGDLTSRGYYQATNVSYNLRKLVEYGYVIQRPDMRDRRASEIELSEKGLRLYDNVVDILNGHCEILQTNNFDNPKLSSLQDSLDLLEKNIGKL